MLCCRAPEEAPASRCTLRQRRFDRGAPPPPPPPLSPTSQPAVSPSRIRKSEWGASPQTSKMIGCHRDFLNVFFFDVGPTTQLQRLQRLSFSRTPEKEPAFPGALRQPRFAERTASAGRVCERNAYWFPLSEAHPVSGSICRVAGSSWICYLAVVDLLLTCCSFVLDLLYIYCVADLF